MIRQSHRLEGLPPYIFSEINKFKAEATQQGISLLSLGIGDPDKPTPPELVTKLQEAAAKPQNHGYSPYEGTLAFRTAAAQWMQSRFGVEVDPTNEIIALIGSKEAIAHFPVAFCNPGDNVLYPSPGYPVFATSIILGGGNAIPVPLRYENGFLPELNQLDRLLHQYRPKYMILNHPANPTSALCPREYLKEVVALFKQHQSYIVYDNAYSEIYYEESKRPLSILEIPGAKDIAIEFHSLSKTYNMTGWRLGWAAGNPDLVGGLLRAKTNIDSGPLLTVQDAATYALANSTEFTTPIRETYAKRRAILLDGLKELGIEHFPLDATFFVWARTPRQMPSMEMCKRLIFEHGLVITPGVGFGEDGEFYFRMALTVDEAKLKESLNRLEAFLKKA